MNTLFNKLLEKMKMASTSTSTSNNEKDDVGDNANKSTSKIITVDYFNIHIDTMKDLLDFFMTKHVCNEDNDYLGIFDLFEVIMYWIVDVMMDENYHNCQYVIFNKMVQRKHEKCPLYNKEKHDKKKNLKFNHRLGKEASIISSHRRSVSIGIMNSFSIINEGSKYDQDDKHDINKHISVISESREASRHMIYDIDIIEIYNYTIGGPRSIESMVMHDIETTFTTFLGSLVTGDKLKKDDDDMDKLFNEKYELIFNEMLNVEDRAMAKEIKLPNELKFEIFHAILKITEIFSQMYVDTLTKIEIIKTLYQRQYHLEKNGTELGSPLIYSDFHLNIKTNIKCYSDLVNLKGKFENDKMMNDDDDDEDIGINDEHQNNNDLDLLTRLESDRRIIKLLELLHKDNIFIEDLSIHHTYQNIVKMYEHASLTQCKNKCGLNSSLNDSVGNKDRGSDVEENHLKRSSMDDNVDEEKKMKKDTMNMEIFPSSHKEHLSYRQRLQMKRQSHHQHEENGSNNLFMKIQLNREEFKRKIKKRSVVHMVNCEKIDEDTHSFGLVHGFDSYIESMKKLLTECRKYEMIMNTFFNENKTMALMMEEVDKILFIFDQLNNTLELN